MISATGLLAISAILLDGAVDVRSATGCPSSEAVLERLVPLLPEAIAPPGPPQPPDVARIDVVEARADGIALHLQLQRADGLVIGERIVELHGACDEMADTLAFIIAAWETEPASSDMPEPPVAPAAPPPVPPPTPPVPVQPTPVPLSPPAPPLLPSPPQAPRLQLTVGAGGGATLVDGIALMGIWDLETGPPQSSWTVRLGAVREGGRRSALGRGSVAWQHTAFAACLILRMHAPVWLLSLDAGPTAGWANLAGSGFRVNRLQSSFEYGWMLGLRGGRRLGAFILWADFRVMAWIAKQQARAPGPVTTDLSSVDMTLSLGASLPILE